MGAEGINGRFWWVWVRAAHTQPRSKVDLKHEEAVAAGTLPPLASTTLATRANPLNQSMPVRADQGT
jgi:hypothetical protein